MKRQRLDDILFQKGFIENKTDGFIIVTEGRVLVDGQKAISPAQLIGEGAEVKVKNADGYVGRGAYKLEAALAAFGIEVAGKICADIGAATGGFTEVLLRRGAAKVYAIDTARGKLALKIHQDPRVVVMERTDARHLKALPEQVGLVRSKSRRGVGTADAPVAHRISNGADIAVIDISLISLRDILGSVRRLLAPQGAIVALFKPQYETRNPAILHHGVIRDPAEREKLAEDFAAWAAQNGWEIKNKIESPIRGSKGNTEHLFYLNQS